MLIVAKEPISFKDSDNKLIIVPKFACLLLDIDESIAWYEGMAFDIDRSEYLVVC